MICPLYMAGAVAFGQPDDLYTLGWAECDGDECGWWDAEANDGEGQCAILTLAQKKISTKIGHLSMDIESSSVVMELPLPKEKQS